MKTNKSRVKRALKLHRAGLTLTTEDRDILFPGGVLDHTDTRDWDSHMAEEQHQHQLVQLLPSSLPMGTVGGQPISGPPAAVVDVDMGQKVTGGKSKSKSGGDDSSTSSASLSLGDRLMQQFQAMKDLNTAAVAVAAAVKPEAAAPAREEDTDTTAAASFKPYVPAPVVLPLNQFGQINVSGDKTGAGGSAKKICYKSSEFMVPRDPALQVGRSVPLRYSHHTH